MIDFNSNMALLTVRKNLFHWYKNTQQYPKHKSIYTAGLKAYNFIKNRLQRKCFSVEFPNFLRAYFLAEHLQWLLVTYDKSILVFGYYKFCLKTESNRVKTWSKKFEKKLISQNFVKLVFCFY